MATGYNPVKMCAIFARNRLFVVLLKGSYRLHRYLQGNAIFAKNRLFNEKMKTLYIPCRCLQKYVQQKG